MTERIGALHDRYLARDRPLGASRVLWEVGDAGTDVRALRARLGLDSGYVSRLLRSLEADGLLSVEASDHDRRVRTARLTAEGRTERGLLDRRSDDLARSLVEPLSAGQRDRLVAAMDEVERLLTAGLVEVAEVDPDDPDARHCLDAYAAELDRRFTAGFDVARSRQVHADEMRLPAGVFVLARLRDRPVGSGALRFHEPGPAEIKRLWVDADARGLGLGRRLLDALEARAAAHGATVVQLDTNRTLTEAIALYRSHGYREVAPFNDEPYADHWFEKALA